MSLPSLLPWLLATLPSLAGLWGVWQLLLRPERCYGYNRALLLLAPVLAALLPLLPAGLAAGPAAPVALVAQPLVVLASAPAGPVATTGWPDWPWLLLLYLAGAALLLGRLAWQMRQLRQLAGRLPRQSQPGYVLVQTNGQLPTSSFGRVVFWDETAALDPPAARAVLAHELTHVGQRHSLDVLWLRVWQAVLWPNPFVHLLLPALRLTHELLADRAAAAEAGPGYASVLARLAARRLAGARAAALLHPFTFSFTLTRLAMLRNHAPVRRWKQWLPLPLLAALALTVGRPTSAQTAPAKPLSKPMETRPTTADRKDRWDLMQRRLRLAQHQDSLRAPIAPGTMQQFLITNMDGPGEPQVIVSRVPKGSMDGEVRTSQQKPAVYTYVEQMPQLPGGGYNKAIVEAIQRNLVYPAGTTSEGKVFVKFTVQADGSVADVDIVKGLSDACDKAVVDAVKQLPRFTPGRQSGRAVAVSFTVPVLFAGKR